MLLKLLISFFCLCNLNIYPFEYIQQEKDLMPPLPQGISLDYEEMCEEAVVHEGKNRTEIITDLAWLFYRGDLFGDDWYKALVIVDAESGCSHVARGSDNSHRNNTGDFGLFQINWTHRNGFCDKDTSNGNFFTTPREFYNSYARGRPRYGRQVMSPAYIGHLPVWALPERNALMAKCIYDRQGWYAWAVCKWRHIKPFCIR